MDSPQNSVRLDRIEEKIDKMGDLVDRVSSNFKELEIFRGRYLKHMFDHKMELEAN